MQAHLAGQWSFGAIEDVELALNMTFNTAPYFTDITALEEVKTCTTSPA